MQGEPVIPAPDADDDDDVAWALQTAAVQWQRGQRADAVVWLRRAVDASITAGNAERTRELTRLAASVADRLVTEAMAVPDSQVPPRRTSAPAPQHDSDVDALLARPSAAPVSARSRGPSSSMSDIPVEFDDDDAELIEDDFDDDLADEDAADAADRAPTLPPLTKAVDPSFRLELSSREYEYEDPSASYVDADSVYDEASTLSRRDAGEEPVEDEDTESLVDAAELFSDRPPAASVPPGSSSVRPPQRSDPGSRATSPSYPSVSRGGRATSPSDPAMKRGSNRAPASSDPAMKRGSNRAPASSDRSPAGAQSGRGSERAPVSSGRPAPGTLVQGAGGQLLRGGTYPGGFAAHERPPTANNRPVTPNTRAAPPSGGARAPAPAPQRGSERAAGSPAPQRGERAPAPGSAAPVGGVTRGVQRAPVSSERAPASSERAPPGGAGARGGSRAPVSSGRSSTGSPGGAERRPSSAPPSSGSSRSSERGASPSERSRPGSDRPIEPIITAEELFRQKALEKQKSDAPPPPAEAMPSTPAPAFPIVDDVALDGVRGFEDLPEAAQLALAKSASLTTLSTDEEVGSFGAALVTRGRVGIMPSIADVASSVAKPGEVVFTRGTLSDGVAVRVVALENATTVASWSDETLQSAMADCPWVADELRLVADRFQVQAGAVLGPLGDRLDDTLRDFVMSRLEVKAYAPLEVIVEEGKAVPGLHIVGGGRVELVSAAGEVAESGPGDFLFAAEVLGAGRAHATARAGKGGALVLFAPRSVAHELLLSVPTLIEILSD